MQIPNMGPAPKDPFVFKDGAMTMPMGGAPSIPVDQQDPCMEQFNLGYEAHKEAINELLKKAFRKEVILWSMDKNWTKDGDCVIVVFYSNIIKGKKSPSNDEMKVGVVTPTVLRDEKLAQKEDKLFDEFVKAMEDIKSETPDGQSI